MEAIAHRSTRRALLLVGAVALENRDVDAARGLLNLLGPEHPARRLLDLHGEELPLSALNDLGDVRVRRHVQPYLGGRLAKQPG